MFAFDETESSDAILSLAVSLSGLVYAANALGLRVCSPDETEWTAILPPQGEPIVPVTAVAVSSSNMILAGIPGGIALSHDGGETWSAFGFPDPSPIFTTIAVSPDERIALAGTEEDGIFRSTDGGNTWEPWNFGLLDSCVTAIAFVEDGPILAGTSTGLFASTNNGRSWKPVRLESDYDAIPTIVAHGRLVWIQTESMLWWRSPDSGKTWQRASSPFNRTPQACSNVVQIGEIPGVYASLLDGEIAFVPLRL